MGIALFGPYLLVVELASLLLLAALVAERRNRDQQRLAREDAIRTRMLPPTSDLDPGQEPSGR